MSGDRLWAVRARANGLGGDRPGSVVEAVRGVVALQAQDVRANRLGVRARTSDVTADDVEGAVVARRVVRTWAMRGTLHMVAAEDLRWVTKTFGSYFRDRQGARRRQLGLDDAVCAKGVAQLVDVLTEPLTRREIVERVDIPLGGQAAPYFLGFAALEGVICRGPERGNDSTYVLVDDWVTGGVDSDLAERYLRGYGPASVKDLAAWSGLPVRVAQQAFDDVRDLLEPVGEDCFQVRDLPPSDDVRLLGHFDAFLLGYRKRSVADQYAKVIQTGGGFVMPAVSAGGRVVGTWRLSSPDKMAVTTFTGWSDRVLACVEREVVDLGRFLNRRVTIAEVVRASSR